MGGIGAELKKVPAWGWFAIGLVLVAAVVAIRKAHASSATSSAGTTATIDPNATSSGLQGGLTQSSQDFYTLQALDNIQTLLANQAQSSQAATNGALASVGSASRTNAAGQLVPLHLGAAAFGTVPSATSYPQGQLPALQSFPTTWQRIV